MNIDVLKTTGRNVFLTVFLPFLLFALYAIMTMSVKERTGLATFGGILLAISYIGTITYYWLNIWLSYYQVKKGERRVVPQLPYYWVLTGRPKDVYSSEEIVEYQQETKEIVKYVPFRKVVRKGHYYKWLREEEVKAYTLGTYIAQYIPLTHPKLRKYLTEYENLQDITVLKRDWKPSVFIAGMLLGQLLLGVNFFFMLIGLVITGVIGFFMIKGFKEMLEYSIFDIPYVSFEYYLDLSEEERKDYGEIDYLYSPTLASYYLYYAKVRGDYSDQELLEAILNYVPQVRLEDTTKKAKMKRILYLIWTGELLNEYIGFEGRKRQPEELEQMKKEDSSDYVLMENDTQLLDEGKKEEIKEEKRNS